MFLQTTHIHTLVVQPPGAIQGLLSYPRTLGELGFEQVTRSTT